LGIGEIPDTETGIRIKKSDSSNWGIGTGRILRCSGFGKLSGV
jgi:hypothetical protein